MAMPRRMILFVVAIVVSACGVQDPKPDEASVVACDNLRGRENELIASANETLKSIAEAEDPEIRFDVLVEGFERIIDILDAQVDRVEGDTPLLTDALREGAERGAAEMRDELDRFVASVDRITDADERGQVGVFQNALEKVFSELEPARSVYVDADLAREIDAAPACRFVTQRADPAAS